MNGRFRISLWIGMLGLSLCLAAADESDQGKNTVKGKKLIEWGWDEPDTKFMRENIETMEQFSFDGLIFHAQTSQGTNLAWEVWGNQKFTYDDLKPAVDDLVATKFHRFTELFLRVNVTPGNVDWFDDQAWITVANNFGVAAQVAKQGHCKGFMFDVEQYEGVHVFNYHKQKDSDKKAFAEYQAIVRRRGQEWIKAVNRHFPDITILMTFGYALSQGETSDRSAAEYGLLADFLDGVLDACSKETTLVDAWEYSYPYQERKQFEEAYQTIRAKSQDWSAVPDKYRNHVRAGFGIWMDHRDKDWDAADVAKSYFSPAEFESAVRSALTISDRYVWIYSERPKWWPRELLPQEYVDALGKARH